MPNQTSAIPLCGVAPCDKPAVFSYVWDWGETGICCAEHQALLQQTAGNLGRNITFTALAQQQQPLERGERVKLIAEKLAAEAELDEVKQAGVGLYNDNLELTKQVQSLTTRKTALELQLREAEAKRAELESALQESEAVQADQVQELNRLRKLVKFADPSEPPSSPSSPQPAVVDG